MCSQRPGAHLPGAQCCAESKHAERVYMQEAHIGGGRGEGRWKLESNTQLWPPLPELRSLREH